MLFRSDGQVVTVRDFGRGIPLEKLLDCSSKINTGAKYDSEAFKKSVGLNGVGIKAVNALSTKFDIQAFREGETRRPLLADQIERGADQRLLQIAVVIAARRPVTLFSPAHVKSIYITAGESSTATA